MRNLPDKKLSKKKYVEQNIRHQEKISSHSFSRFSCDGKNTYNISTLKFLRWVSNS